MHISDRHPSNAQACRQTVAQELDDHKRSEVRDILSLVIKKSQWHADDLYSTWTRCAKACKRNEILLKEVLCEQQDQGKTFLENAIESGDYRTLYYIFHCIENGSYVDGKVIRSEKGLYRVGHDVDEGYGYLVHPSDSMYRGYVGNIYRGQKHGWGRYNETGFDFYEGGWKHDQRHGFGRICRFEYKKSTTLEATFDQGVQKNVLKNKTVRSRTNFFERVKRMVVGS